MKLRVGHGVNGNRIGQQFFNMVVTGLRALQTGWCVLVTVDAVYQTSVTGEKGYS